MTGFFERLDLLVRDCDLVVQRPRGTPHPRYSDAVYPLDYGHLAGTTSVDGAELDVFYGSARGHGVRGVLLTVDLAKRDAEIKVLLDCTAAEMLDAQRFCTQRLGIAGELVRRGTEPPE